MLFLSASRALTLPLAPPSFKRPQRSLSSHWTFLHYKKRGDIGGGGHKRSTAHALAFSGERGAGQPQRHHFAPFLILAFSLWTGLGVLALLSKRCRSFQVEAADPTTAAAVNSIKVALEKVRPPI